MKTAHDPFRSWILSLVPRLKRFSARGNALSSSSKRRYMQDLQRGRVQAEFIARGLDQRDEARRTDDYVDADVVVQQVRRKLDAARQPYFEDQEVKLRFALTRGAQADLDQLFDFVLEQNWRVTAVTWPWPSRP